MISSELFEEIIEISNNGKLIDKYIIRKIVKELISNSDKITRRKFKALKFESNPDCCARANVEYGELKVSLESCYEDVNTYKGASILEKNLHIIAVILHEVEHLKEIYKVKCNKTEGKLINLANYQVNYNKDGDVNYDTYYMDPSEKIAYALSYKKLLDFLNNYPNLKKTYFTEFSHINDEYIERLKYGYKKKSNGMYNVPLIDFSSKLGDLSVFNRVKFRLVRTRNIRKIRRMSIEERLMYGLPVTKRKMKLLERKKYN